MVFKVFWSAVCVFLGKSALWRQVCSQSSKLRVVLSLLQQSLSAATFRTYSRCFQEWSDFATQSRFPVLPALPGHLLLFFGDRITGGASVSSVGQFQAALAKFHDFLCPELPNPARSPVLLAMIEASKRTSMGPPNRKTAASIMLMRRLFDLAFSPSVPVALLQTALLCILAFFGTFRISELLSRQLKDVSIQSLGLTFFLDSSKTDIYRRGNEIVIAKAPQKNFCPVALLLLYIRRLHITSPEAPLFPRLLCRKAGFRCADRGLSYQRAYEQLIRLLRHLHITDKIGFHSFRAGGASAGIHSGFSSDKVKRHGRWRSDKAFQKYVSVSYEDRLQFTQKLHHLLN